MNPSPPSEPGTAPAAGLPAARIWRVGTLAYTSGGLVLLFCWLLFGDFAWSMRERSVGPMAHWYLSYLNVSNLVFGLLLASLPALLGMILGPIISVKSDRYRSKWGRRIPFLLLTTPLAALGMVGLALTPLIAKWVHSFIPQESETLVAVICFGVFWAAFEAASLTGKPVFDGLVNDVVPRELLGRFYGVFRVVSLIDGIIFNYWIMGKVPEHFTLILLAAGLFYGVAFTWMCFKVKEGEYPPPPPAVQAKNGLAGAFGAARRYLKECFASRYYLSIFIMLMASVLCFGPVNGFSIPYARSLGVDMETYGHNVALTFTISLLISYFLGWLVDLFHPLRMVMATLTLYVLVSAWGSLYATTPTAFLVGWVLHGVLSGCYWTCAASLGQRLFPHDKFAQYASAAVLVSAPFQMVLSPLVGTIIDLSGNAYRYTFTVGGILALIALVCAFLVHGQFMKLGGPKNYTAPE